MDQNNSMFYFVSASFILIVCLKCTRCFLNKKKHIVYQEHSVPPPPYPLNENKPPPEYV